MHTEIQLNKNWMRLFNTINIRKLEETTATHISIQNLLGVLANTQKQEN